MSEFKLYKQPDILTIRSAGNKPLVTIHPDGTLEYGPDYKPDEAATIFWDAMRHYIPWRGNLELARRLRTAAERYDNPDYEPAIRTHDLLIEAANALEGKR